MMNKQNVVDDLVAGAVVFLIALPLCLGIALASGTPLFAGIISGAVGGMVVTLISRSRLGVSGPAAGSAVTCITTGQLRPLPNTERRPPPPLCGYVYYLARV